jgi:hypothetical protein
VDLVRVASDERLDLVVFFTVLVIEVWEGLENKVC